MSFGQLGQPWMRLTSQEDVVRLLNVLANFKVSLQFLYKTDQYNPPEKAYVALSLAQQV